MCFSLDASCDQVILFSQLCVILFVRGREQEAKGREVSKTNTDTHGALEAIHSENLYSEPLVAAGDHVGVPRDKNGNNNNNNNRSD